MKKKVYDIKDDICHIDLSEYTHVKVYHACRTDNVESYMKEGIHTFSRKQSLKIVKKTLLQCGIDENRLIECFDECWERDIHHFNQICVCIAKEELLNLSGHYLVYGSEFICGMVADLFCQHELTKIGKPTMFECDVDIHKIPPDIKCFIEDKAYQSGVWVDGGIYLTGEIEPNEIVGYTHPKKVFDPLRNYYYHYR